ncbi:TIGR02206 family membrane protein [Mycoplasmatota bacterium]|nr:TIGR02206 family membrane protein [Mycoplasmatota bacterium]
MNLSEFFKQGVDGEFQYFTLAHFIPLIIMAGIIFLIYKKQDYLRTCKHEKNLRLILAFIIIVIDMSYFWQKMYVGTDIKDHLPLTVCGWAAIFGALLILSESQFLFDIVYFWGFAGSFNALITPAVITNSGPMHFRYYQFWIEHSSIFIVLFYMIFVFRMRPTLKSFVRSFIMLCLLAALSIYVNFQIEGANYLFLASTEAGDSILNFLPTNLFMRVLIMGTISIILYIIVYIPYFIKDLKAKKVNIDLNEQLAIE